MSDTFPLRRTRSTATPEDRPASRPASGPGSGPRVLVLPELHLESGRTLRQVPVAYRTFGRLNAEGTNAVIVAHALTGDTEADRWWPALVGPGKALDTERLFVICPNVLGSPYGSLSPLTTDPETRRPYGADFPDVTVRDTVAAHRILAGHLGVRKIRLAIGGSLGGMQAIEWAFHGDLVTAFVVVAAGGRHSPWSIAWGEAQRQAIFVDPDWNDGRYSPDRPPARGLALARMMAMVSYRSPGEFGTRFGRQRNAERFDVESYLHHHGQKLHERFDANCYVSLTRQMDSHDAARGRGSYEQALASLAQPALVVGIPSDVLYPLEEQVELASLLPNASLEVLSSPYGHDAFLVDGAELAASLAPFLDRHVYD